MKGDPRYADKVKEWMDDYIETAYASCVVPEYYTKSGTLERAVDFLQHVDERLLVELGKAAAEKSYIWSKSGKKAEHSLSFREEWDDVYKYQMTFMLPKKKSELALEERNWIYEREIENQKIRSQDDK